MAIILLVEDDAVCRSQRVDDCDPKDIRLAAQDAAEAIDISNTWQGKIDLL